MEAEGNKRKAREFLEESAMECARSMHDIAPGTVSAEVIQVIRTTSRRGSETKERPLRWVTQYWSLEGELLAVKEDENRVP